MLRTALSAHDRLVSALAQKYEAEGYYVQADDIGHPNGSPDPVGGYIPDVSAWILGGAIRLAEAETEDSIYSEHTRNQWRAFSNVADVRFEVIVPKAALASAQQQAMDWGVRVDQWWTL